MADVDTDNKETALNTGTIIDEFTFQKALAKLEIKPATAASIKASRLFYEGDHWQEGVAWIGPHPADGNPQAAEIMRKFERVFVSKNLVAECVDRERNAVIGRQPDWTITVRRPLKKVPAQIPDPNDEAGTKMIDDPAGAVVDEPLQEAEQTLIAEAAAVLTPWWDRQQVLRALQTAATKRVNFGKGALRLFVPPDKISDSGRVESKNLEDAIMLVYVETPEPEDCAVFTERSSMERVSILRIVEVDEAGNDIETVELSAVDEKTKKTVIVTLDKDAEANPVGADTLTVPVESTQSETRSDGIQESDPLALNGRLALHVFDGRPLTTEQVKQNQKLLNLALTMCGHNVVEAGFSERVIASADIPGKWITDPNAEGGKRFVPDPLPRGAGVTTNLQPMEWTDSQGTVHLSDPKVYYRDPAPVETFVQTKELATRDVYEETHQMHALITGDATASGESRIQALADFVMNCLQLKENLDTAGAYALETALAYAAQLWGKPGRFDSLRIAFDCKIDTGKLTPDERNSLQAEVAARLRSRESYMLLTGQQDPQAELVKIREEETNFPAPKVALPTKQDPNDPEAGTGDA